MITTRPVPIPLSDIAENSNWSLHQDLACKPPPALIDSIVRFGILCPPIVREQRADTYEIICGTYRLWAAREVLKLPEVYCFCTAPRTDKKFLWDLAIEDQVRVQPLSPIEKGRALALADQLSPPRSRSLQHDAIGVTSTTLRARLIKLLDLEDPIREALHTGLISEKVGFEFVSMVPEDRLFLCDLFLRLSLNDNKARRVMELVRIACSQKNMSMNELFSLHLSDFYSGNLADNVPQCVSRLLKRLFEISHPMSTAAKQAFNERVAELDLPEHCSVLPSPSFEQDKVTLAIEYADIDTLSRAWNNTLKSHVRSSG